MTDAEAYKLSTPEERRAVDFYRWCQKHQHTSDGLHMGDMMELSSAIGIIVECNKRLGLIGKDD